MPIQQLTEWPGSPAVGAGAPIAEQPQNPAPRKETRLEKHQLRVDEGQLSGMPVVRTRGELDLSTIAELRRVVQAITERQPPLLVLDLSGLSYMDSSGLGLLMGAKRRQGQHGGEVVIIAQQPSILRALALSGLDRVFRVFSDEQALLSSELK